MQLFYRALSKSVKRCILADFLTSIATPKLTENIYYLLTEREVRTSVISDRRVLF